DPDVTVEDPLDRRAQPFEALDDRGRLDALRAPADRADRPQDVRDAGDMPRDVLFDELASPTGLGEHRRDAALGRDRHERARSLAGRRGLHRPPRAVRVGHRLDASVERRVLCLAVYDEWDEILDEVTGVKVDRVVASGDVLRKK